MNLGEQFIFRYYYYYYYFFVLLCSVAHGPMRGKNLKKILFNNIQNPSFYCKVKNVKKSCLESFSKKSPARE